MSETASSPLSLSELDGTPPTGSLLCRLGDLPSHGGKEIIFTQGRYQTSIFVQKTDDAIAVFLNHCPHAGTPLNMFGDRFLDIHGTHILCRTHGATFDRKSGKCVAGPCKGQFLRPIAHRIENGTVFSA